MHEMITGLNHLTLAISDLERSCQFYQGLLGLQLKARWNTGAYLMAGDLWLCLAIDEAVPAKDYTHYAFSISGNDFEHWQNKLQRAGVRQWKKNHSEGDSIYLLDPDGHQLELHVGDVWSRLSSIKNLPYDGLELFD